MSPRWRSVIFITYYCSCVDLQDLDEIIVHLQLLKRTLVNSDKYLESLRNMPRCDRFLPLSVARSVGSVRKVIQEMHSQLDDQIGGLL